MEKKLKPNDEIPGLNDTSIGDYWAWAYSDILSNRNRGIFAEFLVIKALERLDFKAPPRKEYDCVDIRYFGKTIEVKCSAYIQSWQQDEPSEIKFYGIGKKKADVGSDYKDPCNKGEHKRFANCYVFCLYKYNEKYALKDKAKAKQNVLDVKYWEFYVLSTKTIKEKFNDDKKLISLSELKDNKVPSYSELRDYIRSALEMNEITNTIDIRKLDESLSDFYDAQETADADGYINAIKKAKKLSSIKI